MSRRRRLFKRSLLLILLFLGLGYVYDKLKPHDELIKELCLNDQRSFRNALNVTLNCDCEHFQFLPSSPADGFVNVFSSIGDRHKTILYQTLLSGESVVLKYRKDSTQLKYLNDNEGQFNGRAHFCSNGHQLFPTTERRREENLLLANMNFEIILLKFLQSSNLPVPRFISHCGLSLMQSYGGTTMGSFYRAPLHTRLQIARNLLVGAEALSRGYKGFRIYLTDATKDNIAISESLTVSFIDLDDVIIQHDGNGGGEGLMAEHRHVRIECDNCFAYSVDRVCEASISDINIYTVCQLLLEDLRGNPKGGFLYVNEDQLKHLSRHQPKWKEERWRRLQELLRRCVYCDKGDAIGTVDCPDRFQLNRLMIGELDDLKRDIVSED